MNGRCVCAGPVAAEIWRSAHRLFFLFFLSFARFRAILKLTVGTSLVRLASFRSLAIRKSASVTVSCFLADNVIVAGSGWMHVSSHKYQFKLKIYFPMVHFMRKRRPARGIIRSFVVFHIWFIFVWYCSPSVLSVFFFSFACHFGGFSSSLLFLTVFFSLDMFVLFCAHSDPFCVCFVTFRLILIGLLVFASGLVTDMRTYLYFRPPYITLRPMFTDRAAQHEDVACNE